MRQSRSTSAAPVAVIAAILIAAGCNATKHPGKKETPKKHQSAARGRRTAARIPTGPASSPSQVDLSIDEVQSLLRRAEPPKGGKVVALVYAGGIKGEIEPCG